MALRATIRIGTLLLLALTVYGAPETAESGTLQVNDQCSVALAVGKVLCTVTLDGDGTEPKTHPSGKDWDLWFEVSGKALYINPQNRTAFSDVVMHEPGKLGCQTATYVCVAAFALMDCHPGHIFVFSLALGATLNLVSRT